MCISYSRTPTLDLGLPLKHKMELILLSMRHSIWTMPNRHSDSIQYSHPHIRQVLSKHEFLDRTRFAERFDGTIHEKRRLLGKHQITRHLRMHLQDMFFISADVVSFRIVSLSIAFHHVSSCSTCHIADGFDHRSQLNHLVIV